MMHKLKRFLLAAVAGSVYYSGMFRLWRLFGQGREICVLGLHRVLREEELCHANSLPGMVLREETFARLLEHLASRFHVISLADLRGGIAQAPDNKKPRCLLTFDDGWGDNYTTAYPWLKKYRIPATIFLTTGMAGTQGGFWVEQIVRLWKDAAKRQRIQLRFQKAVPGGEKAPSLEQVVEYCKRMSAEARENFLHDHLLGGESPDGSLSSDGMLTWGQVVEMSRDGVEFGAHTVSHPLLTYEDDKTVQKELLASKQALEEKLGKKIAAFAYPNGDWNDRVRDAVKKCGYELAFTVRRGWYAQGADPFTIPRLLLHEGNVTGPGGKFSPAILALRMSGWY